MMYLTKEERDFLQVVSADCADSEFERWVELMEQEYASMAY